jgi:hypothetical protein
VKNSIIEKIQKLLALATSSNENEAALAAAKAQELLVKYNLNMNEVDAHDADYTREAGEVLKRVSKKDRFINMILTEFFFVDIVMSSRVGRGTSFITLGKRHNVEIASYVRGFLMRAFEESFTIYRKNTGAAVGARDSFYYGMFKGIKAQLSETKAKVEQQVGLVVVADPGLLAFTKNHFSSLKTAKMSVSTRSTEAHSAGMQTGRTLRIGRGLNGPSVNVVKLLK